MHSNYMLNSLMIVFTLHEVDLLENTQANTT